MGMEDSAGRRWGRGISLGNHISTPRSTGEESIELECTLHFTKLDRTTVVIFTRVLPPAGQSIQSFKAQCNDIYEDFFQELRVAR